MNTALTPAPANELITVSKEMVLAALNLDPRDPNTQALVLTCQRYNLDPLLKHAVLIQKALYVTRDGLIHIAHTSGAFDGIEVEMLEETTTHYIARAKVWRKDMSRPFVYQGRYPKAGRGGPGAQYGPEMAEKVAECRALRRAFAIGLCSREETWEEIEEAPSRPETPAVEGRRPGFPESPKLRNVTPKDNAPKDNTPAPKDNTPAPPPDWNPQEEFVALADERGLDIRNDKSQVSGSKVKMLLCEIYGTTTAELPPTKALWGAALEALRVYRPETPSGSEVDDLEDPFKD
jgi:hypothetical protein